MAVKYTPVSSCLIKLVYQTSTAKQEKGSVKKLVSTFNTLIYMLYMVWWGFFGGGVKGKILLLNRCVCFIY